MNRRGFLKNLASIVGLVSLPITIINYDPVKRCKVYPPPPNNAMLTGYKGSQFMEVGYVYAPYIPLFQTCNLQPPIDQDFLAYTKIAYPTAFRQNT
jgi:hypothetical protein